MKRFVKFITVFAMISLVACSNNSKTSTSEASAEKPVEKTEVKKVKIVTTIFPEYDWVKNIIKGKEDNFDVSMLMTSGIDLHNFQPSAKDIIEIGKSDIFIYVGGESDKWAEGVLKEASNKNLKTINLMEVLKDRVKVEEEIEGMEEEEHHHEEGEEHKEGEEEIEYDEHVWLSLKNAEYICNKIESEISSIDTANANVYKDNLTSYVNSLKALDNEYKDAVDKASRKVLLFGDRFPFRYLFDDYGLKYYAAFKGCSAETEASFKTIKFLADKLSEEKFPYVMIIEGSNGKIANAIIENSTEKDAKVETMYSIQAVSSDEINNGASYLDYMKKNLEVFKTVLIAAQIKNKTKPIS